MNERNCKNQIGTNSWISWTWEQESFLSQFPLDSPTVRLANDVCVFQKNRKNMEFYPGTVFPLFLVKMNLASNQATGKFPTKVGTFHTILHPPYQAPAKPQPTISGPDLPYQAPCILSWVAGSSLIFRFCFFKSNSRFHKRGGLTIFLDG